MTQELRQGMTADEVRQRLRGWRKSLASAVLSHDKTHLYYTIEFSPPPGSAGALRLTFDNGKLLIWGEPSNNE